MLLKTPLKQKFVIKFEQATGLGKPGEIAWPGSMNADNVPVSRDKKPKCAPRMN